MHKRQTCVLQYGNSVSWNRTYNTLGKKKIVIKQSTFNLKSISSVQTGEVWMPLMRRSWSLCYKNIRMAFPITRDMIQVKEFKVPTLLKVLWQYFKSNTRWVVRFVHHKGLTVCQKATLGTKLSTGHIWKLLTYWHYIICTRNIITC